VILVPSKGHIRYCRFLVLLAPPLFHPNFGGVPVGPDRRCCGQCEQVP